MLHEELTKKVMNLLLAGNTKTLRELRRQYEKSQIISIEDTGIGFYINFEVSDSNLKLHLHKDCFNFGDVYGIYNGVFGAVGFILFIRNGFISCLEGFNSNGEKWPSKDIDIRLCYDTRGERNIPNVLI